MDELPITAAEDREFKIDPFFALPTREPVPTTPPYVLRAVTLPPITATFEIVIAWVSLSPASPMSTAVNIAPPAELSMTGALTVRFLMTAFPVTRGKSAQ
jgi:hypothetical protein